MIYGEVKIMEDMLKSFKQDGIDVETDEGYNAAIDIVASTFGAMIEMLQDIHYPSDGRHPHRAIYNRIMNDNSLSQKVMRYDELFDRVCNFTATENEYAEFLKLRRELNNI